MKIIVEEPDEQEEDHVIIRCRQMDDTLLQMIQILKRKQKTLVAYQETTAFMLQPEDVFYFEAVDNHVFIYCKDSLYESKQKLYEIELLLGEDQFFRASKSVILNLRKIKSLTPAFSGRFEANLKNNEKIMISRQYVPLLKQKLGL